MLFLNKAGKQNFVILRRLLMKWVTISAFNMTALITIVRGGILRMSDQELLMELSAMATWTTRMKLIIGLYVASPIF